MTTHMASWALGLKNLTASAKLTLAVLAVRANEKGEGRIALAELNALTDRPPESDYFHVCDGLENYLSAEFELDGTIVYEVVGNWAEGADTEFDTFYKRYPRHVGRGHAAKAFFNARKRTSFEAIMTGLTRCIEDWDARKTEKHFIPHPATWLNGDRWRDTTLARRQERDPGYLNSVLR